MEPVGYAELLEQVKVRVRTSRVQAARAVNTELVGLYWHIGRLILDRQESEGWGSKVIGRLAADLRAEFAGMRGLSQRSLVYMRTFAAALEAPIAQQPAAQLPWGHIMVLLDKVTEPEARQWYAAQAVEHGWSRAVLTHHIVTTGTHGWVRHPTTSRPPWRLRSRTWRGRSSRTPTTWTSWRLDPGYTERELEDALVARMTHFFTELGDGFAFVGRQYRLPVGEQEFFIDLLFFHLGLRRYIVFELKAGRVEPGHLGTLNFYVNAVDDLLRRPEHGDGSTIGILLAADRDDVVVEYALRGFETPLAVSTYTTHRSLPEEVRPALPSPDELAEVIRDVQRHNHET